jgi:phage-related minor tail protein
MAAAGIGAAAVAIGAFALKSSADVGGAYKAIENQTGVVTNANTSLGQSFNTVFGNFPVSAKDAATATATVYDRLKEIQGGIAPTQTQVTSLTSSFEEFAKVTGTDVAQDTDQLTRVFQQFHVSAADMPATLNNITQAAQYTHVPISQLQGDLIKAAPQFAGMGIGIDQATASVAKMDSEGLKSRTVLSALSTGMTALGKTGLSQKASFSELTTELDKYNTTGQKTGEISKLSDKQLDILAQAAKGGAFNFDDLTSSMYTNSGAMQKSYEDTLTFSDKLEIFKNKLEVAFAPLGKTIINLLTNFLNILMPIIPVVTSLISAFTNLPMPIQGVVMAGAALVGGIGALQMVLGKFGLSIKSLPADIEKVASSLKSMYAASAGKLQIPSLGGGGAKAVEGEAAGAVGGEAAGAEGLTAGLGGAVAEGGILATVLATIGPILLPVVAIVASIAAFFAVLYATSSTFRGAVGDLMGQFQSLVGWVGTLVGDLTSLNFGKFGGDLISGLQGGFNTIKNDIMGFPGMMVTAIGESVSTISGIFGQVGGMLSGAFNSLKSIDWGGMFAGALDAFDNLLTGILNFDPTPMITGIIDAIGGAFDSLFGGGGSGGTAGAKASGGLSGGLSQGMAKAGPDILGKLGDVFIKLLVGLPVIFGKIGLALFEALSKVDWGTVFSKLAGAATVLGTALMSALKGVNWNQIFTLIFVQLTYFGQAITKAFQVIDWGKIATQLGEGMKTAFIVFWTFVLAEIPQLATWMRSAFITFWTYVLGAIPQLAGWMRSAFITFWSFVIGEIPQLADWMKNAFITFWSFVLAEIPQLAGWMSDAFVTFWSFVAGLVSEFGGWIWAQLSPIPGELWNGITGALSTFGSWLWQLISGVPGQLGSGIQNAVSGFGTWLSGQITGIGQKIMDDIKSVVDLGAWLVSSVTSAAGNIGNEVKNAILGAIGGAGSAAAKTLGLQGGGIVGPQSGGILATLAEAGEAEVVVPWHRVGEDWGSLIASLPHYGAGGVVVPGGSVGVTGSKQTSAGGVTNYNTYVTVDSEDLTRKVLMAIDEKERYHHLLG